MLSRYAWIVWGSAEVPTVVWRPLWTSHEWLEKRTIRWWPAPSLRPANNHLPIQGFHTHDLCSAAQKAKWDTVHDTCACNGLGQHLRCWHLSVRPLGAWEGVLVVSLISPTTSRLARKRPPPLYLWLPNYQLRLSLNSLRLVPAIGWVSVNLQFSGGTTKDATVGIQTSDTQTRSRITRERGTRKRKKL